nr:hypothetical protein Itr_chr15CG13870 [Ipomoea trifida]
MFAMYLCGYMIVFHQSINQAALNRFAISLLPSLHVKLVLEKKLQGVFHELPCTLKGLHCGDLSIYLFRLKILLASECRHLMATLACR